MNIEVNEQVTYGSPEPVMTVEKIDGDNATCGWIDKKGKKKTVVLKIETLEKYDGPPMGSKG